MEERGEGDRMEAIYFTVVELSGDYAWLRRKGAQEEPLMVARALLPEEIDLGTELKYEMFQYEILS